MPYSSFNACSVGSRPQSVLSPDFNKHGTMDLSVVNFGDYNLGVLLGNGDGTFQKQVTYSTGIRAGFFVSADLNNDLEQDLAVTNTANRGVSILLGNGNGTFQSPILYLISFLPSSLAVGAFKNTTKLDLAVAATELLAFVFFLMYVPNSLLCLQIQYSRIN